MTTYTIHTKSRRGVHSRPITLAEEGICPDRKRPFATFEEYLFFRAETFFRAYAETGWRASVTDSSGSVVARAWVHDNGKRIVIRAETR